MVKLTYLSVVRFSGADAGSFLHNQLSADILGLARGESTFACYCEPKGRVLALMLVQRADLDYYVILSSELATAVTDRLKIYRMRSSVDIEVLSEFTLAGLNADDAEAPASASAQTIRVPGSTQRLAVSANVTTLATDMTAQAAWKYAELQMGITWLGRGTSGEFLPQMLGFEQLGAVNYRKGCYPGQEIVARTHYLGKIKRHPRLLSCKLGTCPKPMDKVNVFADGQAHEAVVADCSPSQDAGICLLTVTRMEPELTATEIEYEGETAAVFQVAS
jgi:folate-binding protein YgfZ